MNWGRVLRWVFHAGYNAGKAQAWPHRGYYEQALQYLTWILNDKEIYSHEEIVDEIKSIQKLIASELVAHNQPEPDSKK